MTASCFEPALHGATATQNYNFSTFGVISVPHRTVKGNVFNFNAKPLAGAVLTLDSGPKQFTGFRGGYTFTGVTAGSHSLSATFKGRACHAHSKTGPSSPVTVVVSGGGSTVVNWFCSVA